MEQVFAMILNRRAQSHKYDFGHVLVVGGSPGMVGAPLLAAKAALRVGAGLVTIASVKEVSEKLERRVEEIMTLALPSNQQHSFVTVNKYIDERKVNCLVVGTGLNVERAGLVRMLLQKIKLPLILDGGGLTAVQNNLELLNNGYDNLVLTPHAGEFRRLLSNKPPDERKKQTAMAQKFAQEYEAIMVLKGNPTYIAFPDGGNYKNNSGSPALATAGTGDVLSGMIAGIAAQGIRVKDASKAGVHLHGLAGDIAAQQKTQPGVIASDIIEAIPAALKKIQNGL